MTQSSATQRGSEQADAIGRGEPTPREAEQAQQVAIHYRSNDLLCTHCGHGENTSFNFS
jgi:hypothetical protein